MQHSRLYVYLSALYVVTPDVDKQFMNLSAERLAHNSGNDQISWLATTKGD
jgi:hypothetical protein